MNERRVGSADSRNLTDLYGNGSRRILDPLQQKQYNVLAMAIIEMNTATLEDARFCLNRVILSQALDRHHPLLILLEKTLNLLDIWDIPNTKKELALLIAKCHDRRRRLNLHKVKTEDNPEIEMMDIYWIVIAGRLLWIDELPSTRHSTVS